MIGINCTSLCAEYFNAFNSYVRWGIYMQTGGARVGIDFEKFIFTSNIG